MTRLKIGLSKTQSNILTTLTFKNINMTTFPSQEFIDVFKKTPGAFSVCECIAVSNIASTVPEGNYIEAGSNAGKSGMAASYGLPKGTLYMIDPIYDLTNLEAWSHTIQKHPDNLAWDYASKADFNDEVKRRILFASDNRVEPILLGSYSEKELPLYGPYSYVLIDSDNHQKERIEAELSIVVPLMVKGGVIVFHDYKNQYIDPAEAHAKLVASGGFENIQIDWEYIFNYVRANDLETGNDSWHTSGSEEFPKFVGACRKL